MVWWPARASFEDSCRSVPVVDMVVLLLSASLSCDLKLSRGNKRSSVPSEARLVRTSSFDVNVIVSPRAMIASMASSNCSIKNCSDIFFTHACPQVLQGAKLQLFDCAFAPAQLSRNLSNAFLFGKT